MSFDNSVAIRLENVSKRYRLKAGQGSLRSLIGTWGHRLLRSDKQESEQNFLWALKDVSLEVRQGEVLGIIGPNGAGKTTILKLLSKITRPTSGTITINGRSSSLIELGAGFHPELPGGENVFLNAVILGLTRTQVKQRYDDIVAFAELERFIDMPVKRYSSGMYARLGFAVAAHVDPAIMLVDEVLAVGDASFQRKCYDFIHSFVKGGKTTVFVSHNLYVIEQLCDRVIWLENGQIVMNGPPGQVLSAYLDSVDQQALTSGSPVESMDGNLRITRVSFADDKGNERDTFSFGDDVVIRVEYFAEHPVDRPHFVFAIADSQGGPSLFLASMLVDGNAPSSIEGEGVIKCRFKSVPLKQRAYQVWGEVWGADRARKLVNWQRLGVFRIAGGADSQQQRVGQGGVRHLRVSAPIHVPYEWEY
jgi:lipopolysaccharide transport system ATP-binding protein